MIIARIEAAQAFFANTIVSSPEQDDNSICDKASDTSTTELQQQLALQRQEIENLKRQLQRKFLYKNVFYNTLTSAVSNTRINCNMCYIP